MSIINLAGRFVSMFVGIFIAKILGPVSYGVLGVANLIIKYLGYFDLGSLKCLTRNATIEIGKNDINSSNKIKDTIFTFQLIVIFSSSILFLFYFILGFNIKDLLNINLVVLIVLAFITNKFYSYLYSLIKIDGKFNLLKRVQVLEKIILPLLLIALVYFFKVEGVLLAITFNNIIKTIFLHFNFDSIRTKLRFNIHDTKEQLKTSIQLYFNGFGESILLSLGTLFATFFLETIEIGIYVFAAGFISTKKVPFADPINIYIKREILINKVDYQNLKEAPKILNYPLTLYVLFHALIFGFLLLFYNSFTKVYLTDFKSSIIPMIILLWGYLTFISNVFFRMILDANDKLNDILKAYLFGIIISLIFLFLFKNNLNVNYIAISCSLGFFGVTTYFNFKIAKIIKRSFVDVLIVMFKILLVSSISLLMIYVLKDLIFFEKLFYEYQYADYFKEFLNLIARVLILTFSLFLVFYIIYFNQNLGNHLINFIKILKNKN